MNEQKRIDDQRIEDLIRELTKEAQLWLMFCEGIRHMTNIKFNQEIARAQFDKLISTGVFN